ncbi:MAG: class I SAM-dependent methyltransferase [Planctomycetota bacterium]|nr:MAG: class I SAM-dependent methyltransferase [Planctomycetota bacterium]
MPTLPPRFEEYRRAEVVASYDRRFQGAGARRNRRKARALLRALELLAQRADGPLQAILDVPCGNGRFTALLENVGYRYCGADLSSSMLRVARERHAGASFVAADLARLPFADRAFDAAVCIRFLHLVRDPVLRVAFLAELRRVARAGVVLDYRHDRTLRVWGRRLRHRLGLLSRPPANPSPTRIQEEVESAGLRYAAHVAVHPAPLLSDKLLVVALSPTTPTP